MKHCRLVFEQMCCPSKFMAQGFGLQGMLAFRHFCGLHAKLLALWPQWPLNPNQPERPEGPGVDSNLPVLGLGDCNSTEQKEQGKHPELILAHLPKQHSPHSCWRSLLRASPRCVERCPGLLSEARIRLPIVDLPVSPNLAGWRRVDVP